MKILNLFCGIGGNRTLWGNKHEITAVEHNQQIAMIYLKRFPNDIVIIGDAIDYLEQHYKEFDFIWASPPCQTHTTMCVMNKKKQVPDLRSLYGIIIFIETWSDTLYCVENVIPHYGWLRKPTILINRHPYWSNFPIYKKEFERVFLEHKTVDDNGHIHIHTVPYRDLAKDFNVDLSLLEGLKSKMKRTVLRNCVHPEVGKYILDSITNTKQISIEAFAK